MLGIDRISFSMGTKTKKNYAADKMREETERNLEDIGPLKLEAWCDCSLGKNHQGAIFEGSENISSKINNKRPRAWTRIPNNKHEKSSAMKGVLIIGHRASRLTPRKRPTFR